MNYFRLSVVGLLLLSVGLLVTLPGSGSVAALQSGPMAPQAPLGGGFTYQGVLQDSAGNPTTASCDFRFGLWDAASGGSQIGGGSVASAVNVQDGLFTVLINSGGEFGAGAFSTWEARWLEVAVRCAGEGNYTILVPRQELTAAPYIRDHTHFGQVWSGSANEGLHVQNSGPDGIGVFGHADADSGITNGLFGQSDSPAGNGVYGYASATSGEAWGVIGRSASTEGEGVHGLASAASGSTYGVYGESLSTEGTGVRGYASADSGVTTGVVGTSDSAEGIGVLGIASADTGHTRGVYGYNASTDGVGVFGYTSAISGNINGVYGRSDSTDGDGIHGLATAATGFAYGAYGESFSTEGAGVYGYASAESGSSHGVYGSSASTEGAGVHGHASAASGNTGGVFGSSASTEGTGVLGIANADTGYTYGVYGGSASTEGVGVYGVGGNYAGYFEGDVHVTGDLSASGAKPFKIDYPLDPANYYLYHYSTESSEALNLYSGNVLVGDDGQAWVQLPEWFTAINTDFRYHLTPIGAPASLYVAQEIQDGRFLIAGGSPGLKVSWQVTALRNDPYVQGHPLPVLEPKPEHERGTYLVPELYGQPQDQALLYRESPEPLSGERVP